MTKSKKVSLIFLIVYLTITNITGYYYLFQNDLKFVLAQFFSYFIIFFACSVMYYVNLQYSKVNKKLVLNCFIQSLIMPFLVTGFIQFYDKIPYNYDLLIIIIPLSLLSYLMIPKKVNEKINAIIKNKKNHL